MLDGCYQTGVYGRHLFLFYRFTLVIILNIGYIFKSAIIWGYRFGLLQNNFFDPLNHSLRYPIRTRERNILTNVSRWFEICPRTWDPMCAPMVCSSILSSNKKKIEVGEFRPPSGRRVLIKSALNGSFESYCGINVNNVSSSDDTKL